MASGSVEVTPGVPSARILIVDCGHADTGVESPTRHRRTHDDETHKALTHGSGDIIHTIRYEHTIRTTNNILFSGFSTHFPLELERQVQRPWRPLLGHHPLHFRQWGGVGYPHVETRLGGCGLEVHDELRLGEGGGGLLGHAAAEVRLRLCCVGRVVLRGCVWRLCGSGCVRDGCSATLKRLKRDARRNSLLLLLAHQVD